MVKAASPAPIKASPGKATAKPAKAAKPKVVKKKEKTKKEKKAERKEKRDALIAAGQIPKTSGGLHKMMRLSPALAGLLGCQEASRSQVVSKMWAYIKGHNLQDPADKRNINLDAHMSRVFGVDKLTMFSINKALTAHLTAIPTP